MAVTNLKLFSLAWLPVGGVLLTILVLFGVYQASDPAGFHSLEVSRRGQAAMQDRQKQSLVARFGDAAAVLPAASYARGNAYYAQSCATCHAPDGRGVAMLGGKDLVDSSFVTQKSDAELAAFLSEGRDMTDPLNTTGMLMPPRGGNPNLTDEGLADIVVYLRGLQDPRRRPTGPLPKVVLASAEDEETPAPGAPTEPVATTQAAAPATSEPAVASAVATSTDAAPAIPAALDPEAVKRGKRAYLSCLACHGRDGTGVKGVGKDLIHSPFVAGSSDEDLVAFIKAGRTASDPANTTGLPMPPKGGNPALEDTQIQDIVVYIRSLHQAATANANASN